MKYSLAFLFFITCPTHGKECAPQSSTQQMNTIQKQARSIKHKTQSVGKGTLLIGAAIMLAEATHSYLQGITPYQNWENAQTCSRSLLELANYKVQEIKEHITHWWK